MDHELIDQLEEAIESLLTAQSHAQRAVQTMRRERVYFGLDHNHLDDDIARLVSKARHTKLLATRRAGRAATDKQDASPGADVDGRVVSVSDAGNALVVNPVQDPQPVLGVVPEEVEHLMVVGDQPAVPVGDAASAPLGIPPAALQPPTVDDAPAAGQVPPDKADGA